MEAGLGGSGAGSRRKPGSQTTLGRRGLVGVKEVSAGGQSVEPIYPSFGKEEMEGMMMAVLLPSATGRLRRLRGHLVV